MPSRGSPLARILAVAYAMLVVYASLYPFSGWRDQGLSPFAFLGAPWPRWVTGFDLAANLIGYLPLGFLVAAAVYPRLRGLAAVLAALAAGALLAIGLEALQSYLPARIASNLDVACNAAGAFLGGLLGAVVAGAVARGPIGRWRERVLVSGPQAELGLALLGLWLFVQLDPTGLLFGAGDLRDLVGSLPAAHPADLFVGVEAAVAAANLVAVALIAASITARRASAAAFVFALVVAALAVKTLAFAILMHAEDTLAWATPGARLGLAVGLPLALLLAALPRTARLALAAVLLMAATVLVNLAPPNPYLAATFKVWQQGHFLNFNGLTRLVSALWPFAALGCLVALAGRRARAGE